MNGGTQSTLAELQLDLRGADDTVTVYINIHDSPLAQKWLTSLHLLLEGGYHLEKNYCFMGFTESKRTAEYILDQINSSVAAINAADLGYHINDRFTLDNTIIPGPVSPPSPAGGINHEKLNQLHRYFEDLQGISGQLSPYYLQAGPAIKWHIRQLNLLCHEYESMVLSLRKKQHAPEWRRPSQLMCWLNAPRFLLDDDDFDLFGIESINRPLGGVFVGVNKAVGKHHYEVFQDEFNRDGAALATHSIDELTTSAMRGQTEAAGDFDIEWANNPGSFPWQQETLAQFREWLIRNGFDPEDKSLTIGFPQIGQVDLMRSFGSTDYRVIWSILETHLNVTAIRSSYGFWQRYEYNWDDPDYMQQQVAYLTR